MIIKWQRWLHQRQSIQHPFSSAANYKENDCAVKVLRQKDEPKNKNEKKITETGLESKTSEFFSDFHTVLLSEEEDGAVIPSPGFY